MISAWRAGAALYPDNLNNSGTAIMLKVLPLVAALTLASFSAGLHAEAKYAFGSTPGKLPKNVIPLDYAVHLVPDLATLTFRGDEEIQIDVKTSTSTLVLNAHQLEIDSASVSGKGMAKQDVKPQLDKQAQTLTITLEQPLAPGHYTLALAFRGIINRNADGMYFDKYKVGSEDKVMLGTNMEPTGTRSLFPSWDEPSFRARFAIAADLPAQFNAYSNMPLRKQETLVNGLKRHSFAPTPPMASYLVVLAAGELERSAVKQDGVEIGVVTTVGKQASAAYALKSSAQLVHFYNNYFGNHYPLPKLDQIAVPGGFSGAMENWGGVIYNETAMLYDPAKSPVSTKQTAFKVLAHETAHMWFGDLVTMAWWDNLWLNESFASWMAAKATNHFNPEWNVRLGENNSRENAMGVDALKTTHPIYQKIDSEEQAAGAFDSITYDKGQAFVTMLEAYLGENAFRKGIRDYVAKHKYSNTTGADLWDALSKASGKPVEKIASDWTTQPGFPVVNVEAVCDKGQRTITLSQHQFYSDNKLSSDQLWNIPVQIRNGNGKSDYVLLDAKSKSVQRPGCDGAIVLDPDSVGYYRVQYSPAMLADITAKLASLPDSARLKIVTDANAMVSKGNMPIGAYFDLVKALGNEPRLAVWQLVLGRLGSFDVLVRGESLQAPLRRVAMGVVLPKFQQIGWNKQAGETVEKTQLRESLLAFLGAIGEESVVQEAKARFARYLADPKDVDPELLDAVTFIAGRYADQATYDALLKLAAKAEGTEEKDRMYRAAFSAIDPKLAAQTMPLSLSTELHPRIAGAALQIVAQEHLTMAWSFAQENYDALLKVQPDYVKPQFLGSVVGGAADPAMADALIAFIDARKGGPETQKAAKRAAESIRVRAQRKETLLMPLGKWLNP